MSTDSSICDTIAQIETTIEEAPNSAEEVPDEHWWQATWRYFKKYIWPFSGVKASSGLKEMDSGSAAGFSDFVEPRTALVKSNGQVTITSGNGTSLTHATGQGYDSPGIDDSPPSGLPDFTEYDLKLMDDDGNERYTYYLYDDDIEMHHWSTNIGDADWAGDADDIYVRFYLSKGYKARNDDDDWVRVGSEEIKKGNLDIGDIKHEWTTLDLHEYYDNGYLVHDGVYNIVVCIDREHDTNNGDGEVPEIHKSNNCTSEAVFIFKESPIPPEERQALVALYNSTNGPGWTNKTGWKTESDPCAWSGVTCSDGHVKGLGLRNNQLSASIPPEIWNLVNLTGLVLGSNQFSGSIPPEIGNLVNLIDLWLYGNQIAKLPPNLSTTLVELFVESNKLTFESLEPYIGYPNLGWFSYSPQDTVSVSPNAVSLTQGQNLLLSVNVGGEHNQYQWCKNGTVVSALSSSAEYSKANVSTADSRTYVCHISNTVVTGLTLTTENIQVEVLAQPTTTTTTTSTTSTTTTTTSTTTTTITTITTTTTLPVLSPCPECSGSPDNLTGITFESGRACKCSDGTAINLGTGVIVKSGATVVFEAPSVTVGNGARFEQGSNVSIRQQ